MPTDREQTQGEHGKSVQHQPSNPYSERILGESASTPHDAEWLEYDDDIRPLTKFSARYMENEALRVMQEAAAALRRVSAERDRLLKEIERLRKMEDALDAYWRGETEDVPRGY